MAVRPKTITMSTLNTVVDPVSVKDGEFVVGQNIDIYDDFSVGRRAGRTLSLSASSPHSLYAAPDGTHGYFVEGSMLKRFEGGVATTLLSLTSNDPMDFTGVNNVLVFSNGTDIGYIEAGVASRFTNPTEQFKLPVPPGRFVAFHNGSLYVLTNEGIVPTDAYTIDQVDERLALIPLPGEPTMLRALSTGLWVGKGDMVYWLPGGNADELKVGYSAKGRVVPGTAVAYSDVGTGRTKETKEFVVMATERGICFGTAGGSLECPTEDNLSLGRANRGTGQFIRKNGIVKYLTALQDNDNPDDVFIPASITVDAQITGG